MSAIVDLRLWETYGSRSECLAAPAREVARTRLLLEARALAEQDLMREQEDELKNAQNSGTGGRSSSAYAHSSSRGASPLRTHIERVTTANSAPTEDAGVRRSSTYATSSLGADEDWDA